MQSEVSPHNVGTTSCKINPNACKHSYQNKLAPSGARPP
jgi:hypothetical protein